MTNKNTIFISVLVLLLAVVLTYLVVGNEGFATMWAPTNTTNMALGGANQGLDFLTQCKNGFITKFNIGESDRIWRIQAECSDGEVLPEIGEGGNLNTQVSNDAGFTKLNIRQGGALENIEFINGTNTLAKRGNTAGMTHTLDCQFGKIIGIRGTVDDNLRQFAVICGSDFDDSPSQNILKILVAMYGLPTSLINVTDSLRTKVVNNSISNLTINNTSLGISFDATPSTGAVLGMKYLNLASTDPLRTQPLRLWVIYSINGKTYRMVVPAGQALNINGPLVNKDPFRNERIGPNINLTQVMDYYDSGDQAFQVVLYDIGRDEQKMTYNPTDKTLKFDKTNRFMTVKDSATTAGTLIYANQIASGSLPASNQKWTYTPDKQLRPDHAPSMCLTSDGTKLKAITIQVCDINNKGQKWDGVGNLINFSPDPFTYQQVVPRINPKTPMDYYDADGRVVNSDTWRNESRMTYEADRTLRFKLANRLLSAENDGTANNTRIFGYTLATGAVPKASQKWNYNKRKQLIPDHAPGMCLTSDYPNLSQIVLRPCDDKNSGQVWEEKRQDSLVLDPNQTVSKNGSLMFTNQYGGSGLEYPMDEGFNIGESEFTIGWWQYQTGGGNPRVFSIGNYPNAVMAVETTGTTFRLWQGGYAVKFDMGNILNTWVNFTVVGNRNNTITIYQNGVAKKTDSLYTYEIESWRGWTQRFSAYQKETSMRFMIGNESIRSTNSAFVGLITHFYWKKRDRIDLLLYATGDAPFKDSSDKNKVATNYNVSWSAMSPFVDDSWKINAGL